MKSPFFGIMGCGVAVTGTGLELEGLGVGMTDIGTASVGLGVGETNVGISSAGSDEGGISDTSPKSRSSSSNFARQLCASSSFGIRAAMSFSFDRSLAPFKLD